MLHNKLIIPILLFTISSAECGAPLVAPYVDMLIPEQPTLKEISEITGLKGFTVAFVLARLPGDCTAWWGGQAELTYEDYITQIREFQAIGGQVIVSTGGAVAPYIEAACSTAEQLAAVYEKILDTIRTDHLDIDIETGFDFDRMNEALAIVQKHRANFTLSFTVIVQSDDYGIVRQLGTDVLLNAKKHGVRVDLVNPMTMEFDTTRASYGEAVIMLGMTLVEQLRQIWPEKTTAQLRRMTGNTPMIGKNNNGKTFTVEHARNLVKWANNHEIGRLGFWSVGRDNGKCPTGAVDSMCSGIQQEWFEFSKIIAGFNSVPTGDTLPPVNLATTVTVPAHTVALTGPTVSVITTTEGPTTTTERPTHEPIPIDCDHTEQQFLAHPTDCTKYYHCENHKGILESCPGNTIFDLDNNVCQFPNMVKDRPECDAIIAQLTSG